MLTVPGFQTFTVVHRGTEVIVLRAIRDHDGREVILKTHVAEKPSSEFIAGLRREEALLSEIRSAFVVSPLDWLSYDRRVILALKDISAESLASILKSRSLTLLEAITVARGVAQGLHDLHDAGLIHGSISPSNIVLNTATGEVQIIDLSTAVAMGGDSDQLPQRRLDVSQMVYMAPELISRVHNDRRWSKDNRVDLYALGCTFYELFTNTKVFYSSEPRQLVHAHLARVPTPPAVLAAYIPDAVSRIIMKLLEKPPANRYQTAYELVRDLDLCVRHIRIGSAIPEDFTPGIQDNRHHVQLSQRLFGRDAQLTLLSEAFERSRDGTSEIALVSGVSGIGKTSLVHALRDHSAASTASFLFGKFDQVNIPKPYSGLTRALEGLIEELIASEPDQQAHWRHQIVDALHENLALLIELLPRLSFLTGPPRTSPAIPPGVAGHRLHYSIRRFLRCVAKPEKPLVLFFDDLQWADRDSLIAIREILADRELRHVLVLCAFRSNAADMSPALLVWLSQLEELQISLTRIELAPLEQPAVSRFLADSGIRDDNAQRELASRVTEICRGNPFHIHRYLLELYEYGLFTRDLESGEWLYTAHSIEDVELHDPDSLLQAQLAKLPERTRTVLNRAACLGAHISPALFSQATQMSEVNIGQSLQPAIASGFIGAAPAAATAVSSKNFGGQPQFLFLHDRVQHAALCLVEDDERAAIHLELGRNLIDSQADSSDAQTLLIAIAQINQAEALITDHDERIRFSRLNLEAALRTRSATAFDESRKYLRYAYQFLPDDLSSAEHGYRALACYYMAEAEHLSGHAEAALQFAHEALDLARDPLLRSDIFDLLIVRHTLAGDYREALQVGRRALAELDLLIPEHDMAAATRKEVAKAQQAMLAREGNPQQALPEAGKRTIATLRIMINLLPPADFIEPELNSWLAARGVTLSEEQGFAPESAKALVNLANVFAVEEQYEMAQRLATHALEIVDLLQGAAIRPRILYTFTCYIHHWTHSLIQSRHLGEEAFRLCQAAGEIQYAGYVLAFHRVMNELFIVDPLETQAQRLDEFARFARQTHNTIASDVIRAAALQIAVLLGKTAHVVESGVAGADSGNGEELMQRALQAGNRKAVCLYRVLQGFVCLVLGDANQALACAEAAATDLSYVSSTMLVAQQPMLHALAVMVRCRRAWSELEPSQREQVKRTIARFAHLAGLCPANFDAAHELLLAESARLHGEITKAMAHYDAAIAGGAGFGFPPVAALACDLAARFWEDLGRGFVATTYRREAREYFARWGALRKVELLNSELGEVEGQNSGVLTNTALNLAEFGKNLDRDTMIEAALAVGGKIRLDDVVDLLMRLLLENTGADRAVLFIKHDEGLQAEACGEVVDHHIKVSVASDDHGALPMAIINAVSSSLKPVLVANAALDSVFSRDPYIREAGIQSALCIPLVRQRSLVGVVYLENHLTECAFSDDQIGLSMFIASQAAMSITNALLVQTLEHKVMERTAELEKSREQADSERLAALKASKAKSALLTNVSHELRTPLNAIIGFSDMLNLMHSGELDPAEQAYLKPRESEYVKDIFESSQHLLKLINEMLDLSKIEAGRIELNFEPVDVDELVQSSLTFVRHHAQDRSTRLHYESDGCCKSFVADSHRIKQVLINLLSNAVKFTAPGGTVLLRVSGVDATLPDGGTAILFEVEDDGRGVAEEDRERIFEPFFRSSNPEIVSIPGTGLGLALSRQLVDRHGGSITVTSGERGGALFRVLLPQPKSWP